MSDLTVLGRKVTGSLEPHQLELIPRAPSVTVVTFTTHELTAMCPVTDQPDLYTMELMYRPKQYVVESKTLKLYLTRWRNVGIFGEDLAHAIAQDIDEHVRPSYVRCTLEQQVRGGLQMTVVAEAGEDR